MHRVTYIAEVNFNRGSAMRSRIINNAKAIVSSKKFIVNFLGISDKGNDVIEGFNLINVKRGTSLISRFFYLIFRGFFVVSRLKKSLPSDIVVYYGVSSLILLPLKRYCKKQKIKLVIDIVEWYDYSHLPLGRFGPMAMNIHLAITKIIPECDGVIAISSFLNSYFQKKGVETLLVPVLTNTDQGKVSFEKSNSINIIYAGVPGKKDLIYEVIECVETIETIKPVFLHLIGCSKATVERTLGRNLSSKIICYGTIDQERVYDFLLKNDFSILLREEKRYSAAGFPTKFVESLNFGVPVLANLTSDLGNYLVDGYNGFVIDDLRSSSIDKVLYKITAISCKELENLRNNARYTAVNNFDYKLYEDKFTTFFLNILDDRFDS